MQIMLRRAAAVSAFATLLVTSAAAAQAGTSKAPFSKYLPAETQFAFTIQVALLRNTDVGKTALKEMKDKAGGMFTALTKFAIEVNDVQTIACGSTKVQDEQSMVCVVDGKFAKATLTPPPGQAFVTEGDREFALVDGRLLITSTGAMTDTLARHQGKATGADKAKATGWLRSALAKASSKRQFWVATNATAASADTKSKLGVEPLWVGVSGWLKAGALSVEVAGQAKNETDAKTAVDSLTKMMTEAKPQLEAFELKALSSSIAIEQNKSLVRISATANREELAKIQNLAKMIL